LPDAWYFLNARIFQILPQTGLRAKERAKKNWGHIVLQANSIIAELEDAVTSGSSERRVSTLRQVTDLFLHDGERLSEDQVKVFDDVLCLLVTRVESRARAELGARLAPLDYAPFEVIQHLARDDDIAVAGSVLATSSRLRTSDLVEIASTKGQDHLLAISGRKNLPEAVTDVIVDRGESKAIRKLANNTSARFSDAGYSKIVARSEADAELIEILGLRVDLPIKFLRDLLKRATDAVRERLMALAPPELQEEIRRVLKAIASVAGGESPPTRDFRQAEAVVKRMKGLNELNDATIIRFAEAKKFDEVAASLAILNNSAPTEMMARLLEGHRADLILIPCKSAGLGWAAVERILCDRAVKHRIDEVTLKQALKDYAKLSAETADRTLRFWQLHEKLEK
jgi:integrase